MAENVCPQCGAPINPGASECKFCGEKLATQQMAQQLAQQPQVVYTQPQPQVIIQQTAPQQVYVSGINPAWPIKSKIAAGILGIFLGGIGIHKFYLGRAGMGILYILFCWTGIPAIAGFIEGIVYLCSNDENFQLKNHVRIG
ncbi:MAG: TM2 domain-containing protein [Lachnospiraceae bacterium]|nr:TM2 domain-containing protein [Lachnospiraceae bacterium]